MTDTRADFPENGSGRAAPGLRLVKFWEQIYILRHNGSFLLIDKYGTFFD